MIPIISDNPPPVVPVAAITIPAKAVFDIPEPPIPDPLPDPDPLPFPDPPQPPDPLPLPDPPLPEPPFFR